MKYAILLLIIGSFASGAAAQQLSSDPVELANPSYSPSSPADVSTQREGLEYEIPGTIRDVSEDDRREAMGLNLEYQQSSSMRYDTLEVLPVVPPQQTSAPIEAYKVPQTSADTLDALPGAAPSTPK